MGHRTQWHRHTVFSIHFFPLLVAVLLHEVLIVVFVAAVIVAIVIVVYRFVVCVNKIVFEFWVLMKNNTLITRRQLKDYSMKAKIFSLSGICCRERDGGGIEKPFELNAFHDASTRTCAQQQQQRSTYERSIQMS